MRLRANAAIAMLALALSAPVASAQRKRIITLDDAEKLALRNHPRIAAATFNAQAASSVITQVRSAFRPLLIANVTAAGADRDTTIAAGTLQTSGLASRA